MSEMRWRPFDTAPTDGREILAWRPDTGVMMVLYTEALDEHGEPIDGECYWFTVQGEDLAGDLPTHWMPLPDGPEEVSA